MYIVFGASGGAGIFLISMNFDLILLFVCIYALTGSIAQAPLELSPMDRATDTAECPGNSAAKKGPNPIASYQRRTHPDPSPINYSTSQSDCPADSPIVALQRTQ